MARFALGIRLSYGESFDALAGPLAGLDVPTLLLFGADDLLVPPATGRRFAELIPGSRLVLLPGCGDFPQEEDPVAVTNAMTAFLAETV
jgi:pimeloyl-ACP methyl ester carboxylesterase